MNTTKTNSIAILPFVNRSADPADDYFGEGISEEIINALSKQGGLMVMARSSSFAFKSKGMDGPTIGRELKVGHVLEGSVRKAGRKVRISTQLIEVQSGFQLWSESWDREMQELFEVQDEIALLIVKKLKKDFEKRDTQSLVPAATVNAKAYDLYLQGKYHYNQWHDQSVRVAIELFEKAIALEPAFAPAFSGLAECYSYLGAVGFEAPREAFPKARELAAKALQLDPGIAEAKLAMASVCFWYDWDFESALKYISESLTCCPGHAGAHQLLSIVHLASRNFDQALEDINTALQLDPLSERNQYCKASVFYYKGEYEKALVVLDNVLEFNPFFASCSSLKGNVLVNMGKFDEALDVFSNIPVDLDQTIEHPGGRAVALARKGETEMAHKEINKLEGLLQSRQRTQMIPYLAFVHNILGNTDETFHYLEMGVKEKAAGLIMFRLDKNLENLHRHPRFRELLRG